jgi:two-component system response regulator FixJ
MAGRSREKVMKMRWLLKSAGYQCTLFISAEDFLKNYSASENDLLIIDMNLIGINGCTLLKKLEAKGIKLPVIIITAFDEPKYRECCREYGVLAYLSKPIDGRALIDIIKYNVDEGISVNNKKTSALKRSM